MSFAKTYEEAKASYKPMARKTMKQGGKLKSGKRMKGVRIDQADRLFSLFIRYRANWRCERCFKQHEVGSQGLHCSHFWGRARESTRFDPTNCVAHCHGCHSHLTANPEEHRAWKLKQIGQREYDLLMIRASTTVKKDRALQAIIAKKRYEQEKLRFEKISD